jgi:hypothetical protein
MNKPEHIICAAIKIPTQYSINVHAPRNVKQTDIVVCGRRHHNCFAIIAQLGVDLKSIREGRIVEGFMTSTNKFLDRKEAAKLALKACQIETEKKILYSEDLY